MHSNFSFPKVLVVSHNPIGNGSGNSIALKQLFWEWPRDRLLQLFLAGLSPRIPDTSRCGRVWKLGMTGCHPHVPSTTQLEPPKYAKTTRNSNTRRVFHQLLSYFGPVVRECMLYSHIKFSKTIASVIKQNDVDVVFAYTGSIASMQTAIALQNASRVPIVHYIGDNWIETEYSGCFSSAKLRRSLESSFQSICKCSSTNLCISREMASAYAERYQGKFEVLKAPSDVVYAIGGQVQKVKNPDGCLNFLYAGNLGLLRERAIADLVKRLVGMGVRMRVDLYANDANEDTMAIFRDLPVSLKKSVPREELPKLYSNSDVLLHAESESTETARYTKYSVSTKLVEYFASGIPVLCYAPETFAVSSFVRENGGIVLSPEDRFEKSKALSDLLQSPESRERIASHQFATSSANLDPVTIRDRFRCIMLDSICSFTPS